MQQIEEQARKIPVLAETDILVVGSGPGGLSAALAAGKAIRPHCIRGFRAAGIFQRAGETRHFG